MALGDKCAYKKVFTDDELHEVHDKVAPAEQYDREDELMFTERISKAARLCRHVFRNDALINYYTQGARMEVGKIAYY